MPANLENLAVATGLEKSPFSFQSQRWAMPKNVQTTIQFYTFPMLVRLWSKSFKLGFWMYKLDLEKTEEPEIKLQTFVGSSKRQESCRKTSISLF